MTLPQLRGKLLLLPLLIFAFSASAQLNVDETLTPQQVVQDILLGTGVQAFNITFSGGLDQVGSFDCVNCGVGIESGVVLSSGSVLVAEGPNDSGSATEGGGNFGSNDPDLDILSTFDTNDAAILEFDFITQGDSVKFNYVFGSEEYNEYVCGSVNDAFGFFLSGPGIAGPFSNGSINLAQVPGTNIPVTINTVNNGTVGSNGFLDNCTAVSAQWNQNTEYYIDNDGNPDPLTIQFDGHTVVLTAAAQVICGETYHIKIAIADGGDTSFDSGVFLQESSFTSNEVIVELEIADIGVNDSTIYEGCGAASFIFTRPSNGIPDELTFDLNIGGNALSGIDYTPLPPSITFPFDVYEVQVPFSAFNDGEIEGVEFVSISYLSEDACSGNIAIQVENFYIQDVEPVEIILEDQIIDCGESALLQPLISGGYGIYTYEWDDGSELLEFDASPAYPGSTIYTFSVTDTCGFGPFTQEVQVSYPDYPALEVNAGPDQLIDCLGSLMVPSEVEGGFPPYVYEWLDQDDALIGSDPDLDWVTNVAGDVVVVVTDLCDVSNSDTVSYSFPPIPVFVDLGPDLNVTCLDITTLDGTVNGGVGAGVFTYEWVSEGTVLGDDPTLDVQVDDMQVFSLNAEDQCGNIGTDEITINTPAVPVIVDLGNDFDVTCIDATELAADVSGGVGNYTYQWDEAGLAYGDTPTIDVTIAELTGYLLSVEDECGNIGTDEIVLDVPPVPVLVDLGPNLNVVCVDNTLLTAEVTGGVGAYSYIWEHSNDTISEIDFVEFMTEVSTSINLEVEDECGNIGTDAINLNIPPEPIYIETTADTTICAGDSLYLFAQASGGQGGYTYTWLSDLSHDQVLGDVYYNSEVVQIHAEDQCGNAATVSIHVSVEEIHANFDFTYIDEGTIQTYNNSTPQESFFFWDLGDGNVSNEASPSHSYSTLDPFQITLYVSSFTGCVDSISDVFNPLMNIYVPSAFSPNGDGINDFFIPQGHDIRKFEMWIFNRWGQEVYYTDDIRKPWAGEHDSGEHYVQNEVYTYRIKALGVRGNSIEKSGSLTIIR